MEIEDADEMDSESQLDDEEPQKKEKEKENEDSKTNSKRKISISENAEHKKIKQDTMEESVIWINATPNDSVVPLVTNSLNIDATTLLPYLQQNGRWSQIIGDTLLKISGLVGFGFSPGEKSKLTFYGRSEKLKLEILQLFTPIYFCNSLFDPIIENLPPSFLPMELFCSYFSNLEILNPLRELQLTSGYVPSSNSVRFVIAHSNPIAMADWMWKMLGCFDLEEVDKIIL